MKLEDNEIRIMYYALKAAKAGMEKELALKEGKVPQEHYSRAKAELAVLSDLFNKVTTAKEKLLDINPFTHYPNLFFPEIIANLPKGNDTP